MSRAPAVDLPEDVWLRFLDEAVRGIEEAAREVNSAERRPHYEARTGWFGKAIKARKGTRFPDETSISKALVEVMDEMRAEQFIAAPALDPGMPDLTRMDFHVEVDRRYDAAIGPKAQPTDIQIAIHRDRLDLRIEAKKVKAEPEIKADYLGSQGLERFDNVNAPYSLERFGGMVAYVLDRSAAEWAGLIADELRTKLPADQIAQTQLSGGSFMTSIHVRDVDLKLHAVRGRFRTDVIHLVFEFEALPSLRAAPPVETAAVPAKRRRRKADVSP